LELAKGQVSDLECPWLYVALVVVVEGLLMASCFQRLWASHFIPVENVLLPS
jgi:hypothetical protein